ncbi:FKBP-type peptidyl-prolyl cis-trans isomerase [Flavimobilis sp. GY10621]|uniref:peptidylprolyl isomerase n=1 Tax=Flavimobilis rhizosphaerae TaxID=2775421 RepID=A0ABR9DV17_9MICO|nr:FKBP-type peptidyl-prolyl cis-trans isomerase [Flavimobilis rhizosphaerae]MBD9699850.1 FKBP-type peptidyl-prolyl cis-trans isomerase [Flavimobilis rhizosphaerae]
MTTPHRRRQRRHAATLAAAACVASLGLAACTDEPTAPETPAPVVAVSGEFGGVPTLTYTPPLTFPDRRSAVVWEGDGPAITDGSTVLLDLLAEDASDGSSVMNTHDSLPETYTFDETFLGPSLYDLLKGHRAGARLLLTETSNSTPLALVVDVLAGRASGDAVPNDDPALPTVTLGTDGTPTVTVPQDTDPPASVVVRTLVRGDRDQVTDGQTVIVQYTAVAWSTGEIIDTTWSRVRAPFVTLVGDSKPVAAWNQGLIEQRVGSQVLIVAPPSAAYGGTASPWADETVVYVVDILHASTLVAPDVEKQDSDEATDEATDDSK